MAERITIPAQPRSITGKKVAVLRRQGRLPANVYGKGLDSLAVELDAREFGRTLKTTSARSLFDLKIEGEAKPRPVVLRGISRRGGTGEPIHIDFYQVDTTRPIHATVSLHLTGESPAVRDLAGTLIQNLESVNIRCYPLSIPEVLEVDAGRLVSFDISLTVADLVPPEGVEILTDPAIVIATVAAPRLRLDVADGGVAEPEATE